VNITHPMIVALALLTCAALPAAAQTPAQEKYPQRPIRMLVPLSAGSLTDIMARLVGQKFFEAWGQQVVVDNRPSGGGIVAAQTVATANADGYTLMMVSSIHAVSASLYSKLPYDTLKDFAGVSQVVNGPHVFVVNKDMGIRSVKELIAAAKAKPGQLTYATAAIGTGAHLNAELFRIEAGIDARHIAYKGPIEGLNDVMAGRVTYSIAALGVASPFIRDGRLVALGVSTTARFPTFPDLPTISESGLPGHRFDQWFGLLAPAKTPRPIVNQLSREVARALDQAAVKERLLALGAVAAPSTPEQFDAFIRDEVQKLGKVIRAAGVRVE
jgi:tripartite-type tricarboxylate transporter receptor subunit TctC